MSEKLTLVLGGARSGKSALAEKLARHSRRPLGYLATAQAFDVEMEDRIAAHRADRGSDWMTIEEPLEIAEALRALEGRLENGIILIDCLTLWLTNILLAERDISKESAVLLDTLAALHVPLICVSNETGMGLVPENKLGRTFRDAQGRLNQQIAASSDRVIFVAAGLPLMLKGRLPEDFC